MKMTDKHDDDLVQGFFDAAQGAQAEVSEGLMARVLADADAEATRRAVSVVKPRAVAQRQSGGGFFGLIGGWPAMGGMVAASAMGLWLGLAPPAIMASLSTTTTDSVNVSIFSVDQVFNTGG